MLLKLCTRCQKVIQAPNRYCDKCKEIVNKTIEENKQQSMSRYNKTRDKKYKTFYNSKDWKLLKEAYKTKHPYCELCQEEAKKQNKYTIQITEEIHHKEPIQTPTGWLRRLEWSNLIALCHIHHNIMHDRFKKRRKK